MILDSLSHSFAYETLGPGFATAFDWLRRFGNTAVGNPVEIIPGVVIARPGGYETHSRANNKFECHKQFVDVHFVAEGEETVEIADPTTLRAVVPFDSESDVAWFESIRPQVSVRLRAGSFLVLWPHEAHQPGISGPDGPVQIRKVVVKVAVAPTSGIEHKPAGM